ncbi:hypothetical protein WIW50_15680 [Flavobacteriaceae bacterium 3-367]|uniref:hypothetical protein n=1 Tax=Eudoraea algarum TaxID=3417568 RepID=UPI0032786528
MKFLSLATFLSVLFIVQNNIAQNQYVAMLLLPKKVANAKIENSESHDVKTQAILFKKGKVYELAFADIKPDKMEQLNKQYFPKALELAAQYGGKMIGGFGVVKNKSKSLPGNMVAIFEWPTAESRLKFLKNKQYKKIAPIRDEAINTMNLGYFEVAKDKIVTFRSDKVYEFGGVDLKAGEQAQTSIKKYFEVSEPIKRNYGGTYPEFVLRLISTDSKGQATYEPQMQFIIEWDSVEDNEKLFANKEFKTKAAPLMMSAVAKADFVFTKFSFQE